MTGITAIIPTRNEAHNIIDAIKSVNFADEIIIVDSFSTDKTIELAKPFAHKIIQREYENSASQKNWAIPQAQYPWIFLLDADERVPSTLRDEIIETVKKDQGISGFWIKRQNYFMGKKIRFSGWQGDKVIRLFKRDNCRYENKNVHAEIISKGEISSLSNKLTHNTYISKEEYQNKLKRYARWQAQDYNKKTGRITPFHTVLKPSIRFLKHYIIQLGFLDGYVGLIISLYQAKAVAMRYKYLKEYRHANRN